MHNPSTGTRNFFSDQARQPQRTIHRLQARHDAVPAKVSLRQVRDQAYGAVVTDRGKHERNVVALYDCIRKACERLLENQALDIPRQISERIADLLAEADLDLEAYQARGQASGDYGKFLLFSSLTLDNALLREKSFCVQLFCFEPGQATPIHNHPCECASLVLQGEISEREYVPLCPGLARKTTTRLRQAGNRCELEVQQHNLPHSLRNSNAARSITAHVYTIDGISPQQTSAVRDIFLQLRPGMTRD